MIIPDQLPLQTVHLLAKDPQELADLQAAAAQAGLEWVCSDKDSPDYALAVQAYAYGERSAELALLKGSSQDQRWLDGVYVKHSNAAVEGLRHGGAILSFVLTDERRKRGWGHEDSAFKPGLQGLKNAWDAKRASRNGGEAHRWPLDVPEKV